LPDHSFIDSIYKTSNPRVFSSINYSVDSVAIKDLINLLTGLQLLDKYPGNRIDPNLSELPLLNSAASRPAAANAI